MATRSQEPKSQQSQDFKTKMKVSNPLNDIAANLGVTPKVLTQLATGDDKEFRELVRGIFSILPEDEVALVATDISINSEFLDYLSRLFEDNQKILLTILHNPSASDQTKHYIFDKLSENTVQSLASNSKTPSDLLRVISEHYKTSSDILATLLANSSTPEDIKEWIIALPSLEATPDLAGDSLPAFSPDEANEVPEATDEVDAKVALCVDKLYEINADIVSEFIKKARSEILKRLTLMAKANRLILKTIVQHPSLSIQELEQINMEMFASLLKKSPEDIDDQTVYNLLQQAKKKTGK